ncbi:hypothetical protein Ple7327_3971 [Pleurocapsa sp. PCC 7327]|uniref:DUF5132 domain-containing protein n=1 Tax=Pleurocapsa sp. PCC 7327 TaxID=118163 RepID=UPI00029FD475|nr:DUF5132 domain-containing protein [Pleurocapsa sp. PCC 7327]AFY79117.1 hypothetical protein Ple7327_3971 [Pleurocapsa sp. PCC 7327]
MALKIGNFFEELGETLGIPGVVAGLGAVVLAPVVIPAAAKVGKPVAKAAIKGGILAYEKVKSTVAETGEVFEDLIAEVQAEIAEEQSQQVLDPDSASSNPEAN